MFEIFHGKINFKNKQHTHKIKKKNKQQETVKSVIVKRNLCGLFDDIANCVGIIFDPCYSLSLHVHAITKYC